MQHVQVRHGRTIPAVVVAAVLFAPAAVAAPVEGVPYSEIQSEAATIEPVLPTAEEVPYAGIQVVEPVAAGAATAPSVAAFDPDAFEQDGGLTGSEWAAIAIALVLTTGVAVVATTRLRAHDGQREGQARR